MPRNIFVNLPVGDLERTKAFFTALGFSYNPQFTRAVCKYVVALRAFTPLQTARCFHSVSSQKLDEKAVKLFEICPNEIAACMVIDSNIYAMLVTKPFFQTFTPNAIADARATTEVLVALSCDSKAEVVAMIEKALVAGGNTYSDPQDHGFMYQHGFQDLDGHIWEVMWMNPDHVA